MRQERHVMILQIHTATQRTDMQTLLHHRKKRSSAPEQELVPYFSSHLHKYIQTIGIIVIGLQRYTTRKER
jgi:hypothetical protein